MAADLQETPITCIRDHDAAALQLGTDALSEAAKLDFLCGNAACSSYRSKTQL